MQEETEQTGQEETNAVDENRRQLRSNFDAVNQASMDTRQKTRDLYAGRDMSENERWEKREGSEYVNEVGDNDSSGG